MHINIYNLGPWVYSVRKKYEYLLNATKLNMCSMIWYVQFIIWDWN